MMISSHVYLNHLMRWRPKGSNMTVHYLTQIKVNPQRLNSRKLLASRERIHAALNRCFPDSEHTHIIWRLDSTRTTPVIYMVSDNRPDCEGFIEQYCWRKLSYSDSVKTAPYDHFIDQIENGKKFRFRLGLNPSIKQDKTKKRKSVRDAEIIDLIISKTGRCIDISDYHIDSEYIRFTKWNNGHSDNVEFKYSVVDGYVTVLDADRFKTYLTNGIGCEKAYGCGLMSIIPIS